MTQRFARAIHAGSGRPVVRDYTALTADVAPIDPFELLPSGKGAMRARLRALTRAELLAIIRTHGLNPAGKSLARLSDAQLVTFIVTAVEVQSTQRR